MAAAKNPLKPRWRCHDGFTLLELLISLAIFSVVSIMAFSGFRAVQTTTEHVDAAASELAKLQTIFLLIGRDMQQIIDRPIRDEFGDAKPAFVGAASGFGNLLEFTRAGWVNPLGTARSNLQRVAYGIKDDSLVRFTWPMLDRVQGATPREAVLLKEIKGFELRFLGFNGEYASEWPPQTLNGVAPPALPRAIEVTLEVTGWGKLKRLYAIPTSEVGVEFITQGGTNERLTNTDQNEDRGGGNNPQRTGQQTSSSGGSGSGETKGGENNSSEDGSENEP